MIPISKKYSLQGISFIPAYLLILESLSRKSFSQHISYPIIRSNVGNAYYTCLNLNLYNMPINFHMLDMIMCTGL